MTRALSRAFLDATYAIKSHWCVLNKSVKAINDKLKSDAQNLNEPATIYTGPPVIRVTLASVEETSMLLSRGLDFYGATYFPTETPHPAAQPLAKYKNNRWEVNSCVLSRASARHHARCPARRPR